MKVARQLTLSAVFILTGIFVQAAPIESVESARASANLQKVDAFLSEQIVADQLISLGLKPEDVRARLSQLSDAKLEQLAAQVDLLQAGGKIQCGHRRHRWGLLGCVLHQ